MNEEAKRLNPLERFKKKPSRKTAIDAKCYDCVGQDDDTGFRGRISDCPSTDCPLYPFRPYK